MKYTIPFFMRVLVWFMDNHGLPMIRCSRGVDVTYSHLAKLILGLEIDGFITSVVRGRNRYVTLTEKGRTMAQASKTIMENTAEMK